MKFLAVFALVIAGISALPQEFVAERNAVVDQIVSVVDRLRVGIQAVGLDPLHIKRIDGSYEWPELFNAGGWAEDVRGSGLSNIVINDIQYVDNRLSFDVEIPQIRLSIAAIDGELALLENFWSGDGSGWLEIDNIRVKGVIYINVDGGISADAVEIDSSIGSVGAEIYAKINGNDHSDTVNTFLNETLLDVLETNKELVDDLLAKAIQALINAYFG